MDDNQRVVDISNGLWENMQQLHETNLINTSKDHVKLFVGAILGSITAITLNQWVAILTLLYSILQIGLLIPKYIALFRIWRDKRIAKRGN